MLVALLEQLGAVVTVTLGREAMVVVEGELLPPPPPPPGLDELTETVTFDDTPVTESSAITV